MTDTTELPPQYDPSAFEASLYRDWLARDLFAPRPDGGRRPFVIVIPPPNVTAVLHMGHGLNNTVQDVLIRFERMRGRDALWVPGTDHAGIATQNVVERLLAEEGTTRFAVGREAFVERARAFVAETGSTILEQLKAIGCSCDWSRTRYTLSPEMSRAVREAFVRLWDEGLIYRGHRVIHWCPRCLTSLSDEEAEHADVDGRLYYVQYPFADGAGHLTVATTRPETMLGDVAVAVHPDDPEASRLVGRTVRVPIAEIEIPVLADPAVERGFGTGFVKITPAHDASDFELGRRHQLAAPVIMTPDARMADAALQGRAGGRVPAELFGLDRFEARRTIVAMLKERRLLEKVEPHRHSVRHCYRCDTVVEPRLSDQWFVKIAPLAEPALAACRRGELRLIPEHRGRELEQWLENIHDWNISRQLWWGHRVPVWFCDACGTAKAYREDPAACPACAGPLRQDEDVLDTWFSSWLWPFSTLGWPDATADLARYYPTDVLVTAPEILFLWVARMAMAGLHFLGRLPFHTVYLHGTVRDTQHRKMSKSLGNGIDPLEVVGRFGADALRFTVISGLSVGTDIVLDPGDLETSFASGRNFTNKLWNVGRLVLGHVAGRPVPALHEIPESAFTLEDCWILSRLARCVRETTGHLERFRLNDSTGTPYHFVWDDLADWYLEAIKPRLYGQEPGGDVARAVAVHCLSTVLRLLHPVIPFITEALYRRLPGHADRTIVTAPWPRVTGREDARALEAFGFVQAVVSGIRSVRADYHVAPGVKVPAWVVSSNQADVAALRASLPVACSLARASEIAVATAPVARGRAAATLVLPRGASLGVELGGAIDVQKECARIRTERDRLEQQLTGLRAKLAHPGFRSKAPPDVVRGEQAKEREWTARSAALLGKLEALGC